jgi:UDP-N-acetylenolpyruvoylglucosamine reductase
MHATFKSKIAENDTQKIFDDIQTYRKENYPLIFPSAGCVFKGNWGGSELIREKELAGLWHGDAVISPMIPSFILNTGNATFEDIIFLINKVQEKTKLSLEIEIWK